MKKGHFKLYKNGWCVGLGQEGGFCVRVGGRGKFLNILKGDGIEKREVETF